MRKLLITGVLMFGVFIINAQIPEKKERFILNVGGGISLSDNVPVYMGIDYMLVKNLSLNMEYTFLRSQIPMRTLTATQAYMLGIHYHFNDLLKLNQKWDLYAGPVFELESVLFMNTSNHHSPNAYFRRIWGANIGARYYITDRLALNAKIGYGNIGSAGTFGISVKF